MSLGTVTAGSAARAKAALAAARAKAALAAALTLACARESAPPAPVASAAPAGETNRAPRTSSGPPPLAPAAAPRPRVACPEPVLPDAPQDDDGIDAPIPDIEDGSGSLTAVHDALAGLARGTARDHLRIAMYGDSNLTRDEISGELRRILQRGYGDGGHGYVAVGRPWPWYTHQDVVHELEPRAWRSFAVSTHAAADQAYGFGGIAAQATSDGARAWIATSSPPAPVGATASRFDVFYHRHRFGGRVTFRVDGATVAEIDTRSAELLPGFHRVEVPEGGHRLTVVAEAGSRLFGVAVERTVPGVVLDSLGVGGASVVHLARMKRPIALAALQRRRHALVILLTGSTEDDDARHDAAVEHLVALHREARADVACLVMSPPDFANGTIHAPRRSPRVTRLARRKRAVAERLGCAFWDFRGAMGGELSIVRFAHRGLAWRDLVHLTAPGARAMANRFALALDRDLRAHLAENPRAGCPTDTPEPPHDAQRPPG